MKFWFWVKRPRMAVARLRYWLWEKRHPDAPWLTPDAVRFCVSVLSPSMRAWEFGSGRSTVWFAARVGHIVSIEHDLGWYAIVRQRLHESKVGNIDYRLIALDHPEAEPEHPAYDPMPRYVAAIAAEPDASLALVVVDGLYRSACIRASLAKLKPDGLLLVDDLEFWPGRLELPIPLDWPQVHESTNGIKKTGIWRKPLARNATATPMECGAAARGR
jgi:hypothetical protein